MKIALVAGSGNFPTYIAKENPDIFVMCVEGFSDSNKFKNNSRTVSLLNPQLWLETLKGNKVTHLVFAGKFKRPQTLDSPQNNNDDGMIKDILSKGDNNALLLIENFFEINGFKILPINSVLKDCFFARGFYGDKFSEFNFKKYVLKSGNYGIDLLNTISKFDVGQSLVLSGNLIYAVEGLEGTNLLLKRVKKLIINNDSMYGPVLVKIPKIGQSRKMDLPVIGLDTIKECIKTGISSVVISSQGTIVIDQDKIKLLITQSKMNLLSV
tara:strand:+ start:33 stop:836 length:804 start_codon:yes stop_codon:yes gene_type:complete